MRARTMPGRTTADWAAMLERQAAADDGGVDRVLNQDEIDNLLGFDAKAAGNVELTGVQALINSALVSYERLPMLEIVFDRMVRLATTTLRNFTSDNVEVTLDSISSVRFGDYLNSIPLPAILSVIKAEEWDNYGLLTVDSRPHLFDDRRAARRPPRRRHRPCRGAALYDDRNGAGAPHDRADPGRHAPGLRAGDARSISSSSASRPIRASPRSRARPMRRS